MDFELVVYDEIENFREHSDELFSYPYGKRKILIAQETFDTEHFTFNEDLS